MSIEGCFYAIVQRRRVFDLVIFLFNQKFKLPKRISIVVLRMVATRKPCSGGYCRDCTCLGFPQVLPSSPYIFAPQLESLFVRASVTYSLSTHVSQTRPHSLPQPNRPLMSDMPLMSCSLVMCLSCSPSLVHMHAPMCPCMCLTKAPNPCPQANFALHENLFHHLL